jgi:hypothetical protein
MKTVVRFDGARTSERLLTLYGVPLDSKDAARILDIAPGGSEAVEQMLKIHADREFTATDGSPRVGLELCHQGVCSDADALRRSCACPAVLNLPCPVGRGLAGARRGSWTAGGWRVGEQLPLGVSPSRCDLSTVQVSG